jgi:hypothetical protein
MTILVVAGTRFSSPHWPIRKKNGTSIRSKKKTKTARSCAQSAPSTAVSASARWNQYSFGRWRSRKRSARHE